MVAAAEVQGFELVRACVHVSELLSRMTGVFQVDGQDELDSSFSPQLDGCCWLLPPVCYYCVFVHVNNSAARRTRACTCTGSIYTAAGRQVD